MKKKHLFLFLALVLVGLAACGGYVVPPSQGFEATPEVSTTTPSAVAPTTGFVSPAGTSAPSPTPEMTSTSTPVLAHQEVRHGELVYLPKGTWYATLSDGCTLLIVEGDAVVDEYYGTITTHNGMTLSAECFDAWGVPTFDSYIFLEYVSYDVGA